MQVNRKYLDILSTALTYKTGVKIKAGNVWNSNINTKTLQYDEKDLLRLPFHIVKGLILHEIGHIKYTEKTPVYDLEKKYPNSMKALHNACEDLRIEKMLNNEYGDFTRELQLQLNDFFIRFNVNSNKDKFQQMPRLIQFIFLMYASYQSSYNNYVYGLIGYRGQTFMSNVKTDKEVIKRFEKFENAISDFTEDISEYVTHQELKDKTASSLVPIITDFIKEYEKEIKRNSKGKKDDINKDFQKDTAENIKKKTKTRYRGINKPSEIEAKALYHNESYVLSQRIRDILKERTATKFTGAYKSGKLLSKNAYKILNNETKVFSRKVYNDKPSGYRIFLGLDNSGSMQGDRSLYTFLGSCILKSVSEKIDIETEIYRYDTECSIIDNLDDYNVTGGGTDDLCYFSTLHEKLKSENNETIENIIFIITDGENYTHDHDKRSRTIKELNEMNSKIIAIGIGDIQQENFNNNYENPIIVEDVGQLPTKIVDTMRSIITR